MQKKLIALAIAGLASSAAFAQTNVTVYGVADVAYEYNQASGATFSGLKDGGWSQSRIGFKGEEALGNGLKAIFQMEYAAPIDQNQGFSNVRQSWVGLSGNFGTVSAGRQYAPSFLLMGKFSANEVTSVNPMNVYYNAFKSMGTGNGARWNNSVAYTSPVFSGLTARAIYAFGANNASGSDAASAVQDTTDAQRIGLALDYANGPIGAAFIYQGQSETTDATNDKYNSYYIGGSYDFGVVKAMASYQKESNEGAASDPSLWSIGAIVPVSAAGKVRVEYAQLNSDLAAGNDKSRGFGIGYTHDLSKRTTVYTYASKLFNDDNVGSGTAFSRAGTATANGDSNSNFTVGIRHVF